MGDRSRGSTPTRTKSPSISSHHDDRPREVHVQGRDGNRAPRGGGNRGYSNQHRADNRGGDRYAPRRNDYNANPHDGERSRRNQYQPRRGSNRGSWAPGRNPGPRPMPVAPTVQQLEDFDFEKANAEFVELTSKVSDLKVGDAEPGSKDKEDNLDQAETYNKTKSFFDSISCEAIERSKG